MPEVNRKKNRDWNGFASGFCGNESELARSPHGRRIERRNTGALRNVCRLRNYLSFLVDEYTKSHVRLNFLGVEGSRISEGEVFVEHYR